MSFTVDDSAYPLLVTSWRGESTVADIHAYAAVLRRYFDRALAEGRHLALIDDATAVTRTSPAVRKAIAALGPAPGVVVGTWLISDSSFIRGVMTALSFLNPAMRNVFMVASFAQAEREARALLLASE